MAALLLFACAAPEPSAPPPSPAAPASDVEDLPDTGDGEGADAAADGADIDWRIAVLVPLTGPDRSVGENLLRAATMALFDALDPRISLLPFDTAGTRSGAEQAAKAATDAGAHIILGPLRGDNVAAVSQHAPDIPLISFSNDRTVAAPGRYIFGLTPETEIAHITAHARASGLDRFAALLPGGLYGDRILSAFGTALGRHGGDLVRYERYVPDAEKVFDPIRTLTDYDQRRQDMRAEIAALEALNDDVADALIAGLQGQEVLGTLGFDAVLIAEGGALLRTVAPLIPYYEGDSAQILGTGLMNDPGLATEPPLYGARFAAPAPAPFARFSRRYTDIHGAPPARLSSLAYDAMALLARLVREAPNAGGAEAGFSQQALTRPAGFVGMDGPFRLLPGGEIERSLAILEITPDGLMVQTPARAEFTSTEPM